MSLDRAEFDTYLRRIENVRGQNLSEADTRAYLIDPLLHLLGYDSFDTLRREVQIPATKEFLDYELRSGGKAIAIVEAKALRHSIAAQHAAQCVQYASVLGIRWCLISNGVSWLIYDGNGRGDLNDKKVAEIRLDASSAEMDEALRVLSCFAHDTIPLVDRSPFMVERVLRAELSQADSASIAALRNAVRARLGQRLDSAAIVEVLRRMMERPRVSAPTPDVQADDAALPSDSLDSDSTARIPLKALIDRGLLPPNAVLEFRWRKQTYTGQVRNGAIEVDGRAFPTPSAAGAFIRQGAATNGWKWWRYNGEMLWTLRERLRDG
jgi:predicted type IV restriction endonuclease